MEDRPYKTLIVVAYFIGVLTMYGVISMNQLNKPCASTKNEEWDVYKINIIDETEVRLTTEKDTIILYFENATVLSEETTVFVKK